jgi:predicted XRE-type DNA-binding protein
MTKATITPAHVANLANLFSPSDIADILKIPQSRVEELLDEAGSPRETWEVRALF